MRFRIRTRHDLTWPLGWTAVALELASILTWMYSILLDHLGNTYNDPVSWVIANLLLLAGGLVAILTLCVTALTTPTGRGWRPALGALGVGVLIVATFFLMATQGGE